MNQVMNYYMSILRSQETNRRLFRMAAHRLADLLAAEVAKQLPTKTVSVQTPLAKAEGIEYAGPHLIVPVLRSGIAMLSSFLNYFPDAFVGVVGLKRDEKTAIAHQYYCNIPPISDDMNIMIIDPMLATGGTSIATIQLLRDHGARDKQIYFVCMISAPEGIKAITQAAKDVTIITAITDEKLNDKKFIMPGLGDFGDRYFGTE